MVADDLFSEETKVSAKWAVAIFMTLSCMYKVFLICRVFDSVIGNLSKNFSEGNEYFKVGT